MTPALVVAAADQITVPSWLNTAAIMGLAVFVASLLLLFLGLAVLSKSHKGDLKGAGKQLGVGFIGILIVALGAGGAAITIAAATLGFFVKA